MDCLIDLFREHTTIVGAIVAMAIIGLLLGVIIGVTAKLFKVDSDPRIELVTSLLPGANCGGCGKAGCTDFAKAVVANEIDPSKCPVSSQETITTIAQALGITSQSGFKKVAVVLCAGDLSQTEKWTLYNGVNDCRSAMLVAGGPKACKYGCLGMSSCARACPFGAIEIINGLAVVHQDLCVGCGKCVEACPRNLIKLVNADAQVHVFCNNPEKGPVKKQYCSVPCLGCRKCQRYAPEMFNVDGFKATVNYDAEKFPTQEDIDAIKCPTSCLLTYKEHVEIEYATIVSNDSKATSTPDSKEV